MLMRGFGRGTIAAEPVVPARLWQTMTMPRHDSTLPRAVDEIENAWITMSDGCRLAARLWLPADAGSVPVPAILEYIPYRKRDFMRRRDEGMHRWFAGHGYAAVRVDMRGSGESDGVMHDEYLPQEQDDALEVIDWIARQPWCSGRVGMMGKSWGAYNSLQVAARRPAALKAIIAVMGTDDRYAECIHYSGGCLLNDNFWWGCIMQVFNARPPDPEIVGERWREMWLERLEVERFWPQIWLNHQTLDEYWKRSANNCLSPTMHLRADQLKRRSECRHRPASSDIVLAQLVSETWADQERLIL